MSYSRAATVVVLVVALAGLSLASIENKPVKVTHRNSGPKYEIEETIDKTKLTPVTENNQQNPQSNNINTDNFETPVGRQPLFPARPPVASNDDDADTVGHIAIRRIFLVPMMRPQMPASTEEDSPPSRVSSSSSGSAERDRDEMPSMFAARPSFWPFSPPSFPHHQHNHHQPGHVHLFGGDTASRPPMMSPEASEDRPQVNNAGSGERENAPEDQPPPREQPLGDPVQMLVDLMRQAINQAVLSPNNFFNPSDLNRPTTTQGEQNNEGPLLFRPPTPPQQQQPAEEATSDRKHQGTDLQSRPSSIKPASSNDESSEEVVEIGGKKYLRKTVVNRHIGENIVLVTRRLIFVPLNETSEEGTTTVTPISSPSTTTTTTPVPVEASTTTTTSGEEPAATSVDSRKVDEPTTTTTTTTTTSTTAAPSTTSQEPAEVSSSTTAATSTTELPSSTTTTTTTQAPEKEETTSESEKLDEKNKEEPTTLKPSS